MTPKEKAEELVGKYFKLLNYEFGDLVYSLRDKQPQQCALIAIDEILNNAVGYNAYDGVTGNDIWIDTEYWQEVKKEIHKL